MKDWMGQIWCKMMHRGAMWPIHGRYVCPQCLREHRVAWDGESTGEAQRGALSTPLVATVHAVDSYRSPVLR